MSAELAFDGAKMQSNGDKNHSSNLVLCGKFIHEFDIQSHEFESSIVRLDNAFFKLTNVRLKENANLTLQYLSFLEHFCILLKLLSNCVQNTNMFLRVQILDVCAPLCVLQVWHPGGVFS
jgi:hypothetical protein